MSEEEKKETGGEPHIDAASESKAVPEIDNGSSKSKLPDIDAPPLSPASAPAAAAEPQAEAKANEIKVEPASAATVTTLTSRRWLRPRHKRHALLAASFLLAAGLGSVLGAFATGHHQPPRTDATAVNERKALQQSIEQLNKQLAALKGDLDKTTKAALDHAKAEQTQIAKLSERLTDITGALPAREPAPPQAAAVPMPRPAPHIAAAESRPAVLQDWVIHGSRGGYIYVRGHGEIYQVVPGAPLPGLGPVQAIKRENGSWIVVTPKGLIVAGADRRNFE